MIKNEVIDVTVTSLSHGGSGVGRFKDFVIFTPYTAPGDQARVRVTSLKKNYAEAELVEIISPSPHRVKPPCSVFGVCGGCQWQHVSYQEQLNQKQKIVEHNLTRISKEESVPILPIIASPKEFHYRNRVQVRAQGAEVGFYQRKSHNLIEFAHCHITDEKLNDEIVKIKNEREEMPAEKTAKVECYLAPGENGETRVLRSTNRAHGEETGFAQVNTLQNENMRKYLASLLPTPSQVDDDNAGSRGNLLDLYCGNGNFSFPLNEAGWRVYGVDMSRPAILSARNNANKDTFFSVGDCSLEVKKLAERNRKFEAVLLDPPRVGADERLWANLVKLSPERIVYVSCNPATFARDWARLKAKGPYKLVHLQPFDMFPQTYHVELAALAVRV